MDGKITDFGIDSVSLDRAIQNYRQKVIENPRDAHAHHHLAMFYFQQRAIDKAIQHFLAALKAEPTFLSAHYHLGVLYFKHNNMALAKLRFLSVLDLDEKHLSAHFYLGIIFLKEEEWQQAEWHFLFILTLDPYYVSALVNLGVLALKRNVGQAAIHYFTQALVIDESHVDARRNLAATFLHYDRFENALTHYYELEKQQQLDIDDIYNMAVALMALGDLNQAIQYYKKVLCDHPKHFSALNNLAAIYIRKGDRAMAIQLLREALKINPTEASSQFMLDVLEEKQEQPKESNVYIKNLFNNYAFNYDQHMQKTLSYELPKYSFHLLMKLHPKKFLNALDLGCGTGLSGLHLSEHCEYFVGVDLSEKMLAQARIKKCYDALIEQDILSFLQQTSDFYEVIQALDVLPYFGDLEAILSAMVERLSPLGWLAFSVEISYDRPWKIQNSMRFCHALTYVQNLLKKQGLQERHCEKVVARKENEQALHVYFMVYQKDEERVSM